MGQQQSATRFFGGSSNTPVTITVSVNVYDLIPNSLAARFAKSTGFGLYHTGVVVQIDSKPEGTHVLPF